MTGFQKSSTSSRYCSFVQELNYLISNKKNFIVTELYKKYSVNTVTCKMLINRGVLLKIGTRYIWKGNQLSIDSDKIKLYASWAHQDINEYNSQCKQRTRKNKENSKSQFIVPKNYHKIEKQEEIKTDEKIIDDGFTQFSLDNLLLLKNFYFEHFICNDFIFINNIYKISFLKQNDLLQINVIVNNGEETINHKNSNIINIPIQDFYQVKLNHLSSTFEFKL
jgi:hypothetical protein